MVTIIKDFNVNPQFFSEKSLANYSAIYAIISTQCTTEYTYALRIPYPVLML